MRRANYESTWQEKHKNQMIAKIIYDQNLMSIFKKHLITKKWNQMKSELNKLTCTSLCKIWHLSKMRQGNISTKQRKEHKVQKCIIFEIKELQTD